MSAIEDTLNQREHVYGDFDRIAGATQAFKSVCRNAPSWSAMTSVQREAIEMVMLKSVRILYGDPMHYDSWHDIAGYAALATEEFGKTRELKPAANPVEPVDLLEAPQDEASGS